MKLLILFAVLAASMAAKLEAPRQWVQENRPPAIISSTNVQNPDGSFSYSYETEDGIKAQASGSQKQVGPEPEDIGTVQSGSYSYTDPDGNLITVTWTADENGFVAQGAHLPTPPPVPDHVAKMLADLKAAGRL